MKKRVVITGGNGFIGSFVVEQLLKKGHHVTCLVRKESSLSNLKEYDVDYVYGDVTDKECLTKAFTGADVIIHNAAVAKDWGEYDLFFQTNVVGTENVIYTCVELSIPQVIMTGSISSYGEENSYETKDETSPFNSHYSYFLNSIFPCKMNYYRDSKAEATRRAIAMAKENNLNLTILEPSFVYGEREFNSGFYEYVSSVKEGMSVAPGSKKNYYALIYVRDLACAFSSAVEKESQGVERFIITNSEPVLMNNIYRRFCKEAELKMPNLLPKFLIYPAGLIMELLYTLFRFKNPPLLTRGRINMFYDNLHFSSAKAKNLLGFETSTSLEDGIKKTVEWYKDNGYL